MKDRMLGVYSLVITALLAGLVLGQAIAPKDLARAQTADSGSAYALATGESGSGSADLLYVLDCQKQSLCVYQYRSETLNLLAARTVTYDVQLPEFKTKPSVKEMKREYDEWLKKVAKDD